jgi:hypothetical protein
MSNNGTGPDGGHLPAWDRSDLPEPKPFGFRNLAALIGPGIVVMGGMVAQGEWLLGPKVTAQHGAAVLWIATLSTGLQVFLNTGCARYALYTGEPVFSGCLRCRPGPKFRLPMYAILDIGSIWPAAVFAAATALAAAVLGRLPGPEDRQVVIHCGYLSLLICVLWVIWGGKIYNAMQLLMTIKVFVVLGFLIVDGVVWVPWHIWWDVFSGWSKFGVLPADLQGNPIDWALLAGFAAYASAAGSPMPASATMPGTRAGAWGRWWARSRRPLAARSTPCRISARPSHRPPRTCVAGRAGGATSRPTSTESGSSAVCSAWPCRPCSRWRSCVRC